MPVVAGVVDFLEFGLLFQRYQPVTPSAIEFVFVLLRTVFAPTINGGSASCCSAELVRVNGGKRDECEQNGDVNGGKPDECEQNGDVIGRSNIPLMKVKVRNRHGGRRRRASSSAAF
jgi:hypothetical protein